MSVIKEAEAIIEYFDYRLKNGCEVTEANIKMIRETIQSLLDEVKRRDRVIDDINCLIGNSHGVYGLHLNGDLSPWDELLEGDQYESWLRSLDNFKPLPQPPVSEQEEK